MTATMPDGALLAIDASTTRGSVAILRDGEVLTARTVAMRAAHEEPLLPAVADALAECAITTAELSAVAAGDGPGSFTGLRIAAATAKGVAMANDLPLYAVPTLPLVVAAWHARAPIAAAARGFLVLLDAMRGECFVSRVRVDEDGKVHEWEPSRLMTRASALGLADEQSLTPVGPAEQLEWWPHARGLTGFSAAAPSPLRRVDVAAWEPDYGRLAEAQLRWEAAHGRPLRVG